MGVTQHFEAGLCFLICMPTTLRPWVGRWVLCAKALGVSCVRDDQSGPMCVSVSLR